MARRSAGIHDIRKETINEVAKELDITVAKVEAVMIYFEKCISFCIENFLTVRIQGFGTFLFKPIRKIYLERRFGRLSQREYENLVMLNSPVKREQIKYVEVIPAAIQIGDELMVDTFEELDRDYAPSEVEESLIEQD